MFNFVYAQETVLRELHNIIEYSGTKFSAYLQRTFAFRRLLHSSPLLSLSLYLRTLHFTFRRKCLSGRNGLSVTDANWKFSVSCFRMTAASLNNYDLPEFRDTPTRYRVQVYSSMTFVNFLKCLVLSQTAHNFIT